MLVNSLREKTFNFLIAIVINRLRRIKNHFQNSPKGLDYNTIAQRF